MEDYAKMYFKLFNDITEVIQTLQNIQQEAEEMFLSLEPKIKAEQSSCTYIDMGMPISRKKDIVR